MFENTVLVPKLQQPHEGPSYSFIGLYTGVFDLIHIKETISKRRTVILECSRTVRINCLLPQEMDWLTSQCQCTTILPLYSI